MFVSYIALAAVVYFAGTRPQAHDLLEQTMTNSGTIGWQAK
jgi:hypothetical protein